MAVRTGPAVAFVLAGGASLAAMQAGMLRALYERGIRADLLVATSAGALNAAFIASRPQTVDTARELAEVWRGLHRQDVFPIHPPTVIAALANQRDHLVPDRALRHLAASHLEIDRLEHAHTPLHLAAFDILRGEAAYLSEGPALDAVLAAAAIPGVLPPVRWGRRLLVDGGLVANTPIARAIELGAERVYVLPTQDPASRGVSLAPRGALDAAVHAFMLLVDATLESDLRRYAEAAELILLPATNPANVQATDFDQADRLMRAALLAARQALDGAALRLAA
jgi:NTE family protein